MYNLMASRVRMWSIFISLILMTSFLLVGCNEDLVQKSYDTIKAAEITYNAAHQVIKDMDQRGQLTDEDKKEIVAVASKYYRGVQVAKQALIQYKMAIDRHEDDMSVFENSLTFAVNGLLAIEPELIKLLNEEKQ